jgi:hypothetical protein
MRGFFWSKLPIQPYNQCPQASLAQSTIGKLPQPSTSLSTFNESFPHNDTLSLEVSQQSPESLLHNITVKDITTLD